MKFSCPPVFPLRRVSAAEATYRLALFAAEDGDAARARTLGEQALALCAGCASEGAIRNFQAGLRLAAGAATEAREHARRALELNRGLGDKAEEANSLRLLADAALRLKDYAAAGNGYQEALALDKDAGHPRKIGADLLGLGEAALAQGKNRTQRITSVVPGLWPRRRATTPCAARSSSGSWALTPDTATGVA